MKFDEININTREGLLLNFAIGKLMQTDGYKDKTPDEIFNVLEELRKKEQNRDPMIFPVELFTTFGIFNATIVADEAEYAASQAVANTSKTLFTGEDGSLLRIAKPEALLGLKVHPASGPADTEDAPEPFTPLTAPYNKIMAWDSEKVEYLGNKYQASFLTARVSAGHYFTVYVLNWKLQNGKGQISAASESGQKSIVHDWINTFYVPETWYHYTIIPHGDIADEEEAIAYLKDYVSETAPERKPTDKNAKAFQGWREKPKGAE